MQRTMTRTYKHTKDFRRDAAKLAKQGWNIQQVVEHSPEHGCFIKTLYILTLGIFALIFPKRNEIIVTYVRDTLTTR